MAEAPQGQSGAATAPLYPGFPQIARVRLDPDPKGGGQGGSGAPAQGAAPAHPASPSIPDGFELVRSADAQQWRRGHEQFSGYSQRLKQAGVEKIDDLLAYGDVHKAASKYKLTPAKLARAIELEYGLAPGEGSPDGGAQTGTIDPAALREELKKELLGELDKREARSRALSEHGELTKREKELLSTELKKVLKDAGDVDMEAWSALASAQAEAARKGYPANHPLAEDHFAPLDEKGITSLVGEIGKKWALRKGKSMSATASAAGAPPSPGASPSTPAGGARDQGAPTDDRPARGSKESIRAKVGALMGET